MRTSQEIYHRVRWDARFDASRFVVGVENRGREPKRVPLPSFDPQGDIPWHRVLFFEADGQLVWDRASGVDALDASGAGLAQRTRLLAAPFFEPRTPHAFMDGRWQPCASSSSASSAPAAGPDLRVLTWNTLWDRYDKELVRTAERRPMLLAALRDADVDVIALQEAEPALVKMLLAEEWVRAGWTLGGDPRSSDVADSGLFLLSRLPVVEAGWHALGRYKAVTALVVEGGAGPVVVATTHLSSDHSKDGAGLRREQLGQLADGSADVASVPVVLVGDFNDDTEAPAARLGMTDAWTQVHGVADDTATFDPTVNPLAAVSSLTGQAKRLDRVLLLGAEASAARLVGDAPDAGGLFVSDHFGISAVVTPQATADPAPAAALPLAVVPIDATPTARTAIAWIPPTSTWDAVQEVRRRLDPQVLRWPPHVNLLFGFIPESEFDAALPLLSKAAAATGAFETQLTEVRHFTHRTDSTLWLHPTGAAWQKLYTALAETFPTCRTREAYTPHLTIGKVTDPTRTPVKIAPIITTVTELALLSRRADGPMEVRAIIELGTGAIRYANDEAGADIPTSATPQHPFGPGACLLPTTVSPPSATASLAAGRSAATPSTSTAPAATPPPALGPAATLTARITETLPEAVIHLVGSRRTGTHLPGADLDLVAAVPGTPDIDALERRVTRALGEGHRVRQLVAARVPGLRIVTPRLSADLVLAPTGDIPPAEAVARRSELGETIASSLSAVSDAEAILALRPGPHVRVAKDWARARGLDAAPLGGLPGLAWALMAARCRDLTEFFETWAAHDWREPIPTPTAPIRDLTLHLTPAMRDLITEELYNAWETVTSTRDPLPALLAPPPMHRRHRRWAVLTLTTDGIEQRDVLEGRVRGRARSLLSALDEAGVPDAHAWPRPFHATDTELRSAIGLGRTPPTRDELAEIAKPWLRGLTGVTLELAANGDVPTLS
ncbi:poly(A) polymerase [Catenulispora sp. GAS73]|uniref:RNA repair domain-containing protein n=1 Tax=Catenulispora sp. GAS73 TaxID=3156269 RepID=UPI003517961C